MSQATLPVPATTAHRPPGGYSPLTRTLLIVAALSAAGGLLATTMSDRTAATTEAPRQAPASSELPAWPATGSTTVPDASAVFRGREVDIEEPAPTF
jgi:hypothetical protein